MFFFFKRLSELPTDDAYGFDASHKNRIEQNNVKNAITAPWSVATNLKEKTHYIKSDDVWVHHYNPSHYKLSENFIPYCRLLPSNKTRW